MNSVTTTVVLYQEPLPAGVQPDDTIIYFRQFLPMWADSVGIGLGTWKDWDWNANGSDPLTDIHNNSALVDLGGDDLTTTVERRLTWVVSNGECPRDSVEIRIERNDLVTYTAFSPNGDLFNEYLILDGLEFADQFTMNIYSRHMVLVKTITEADLMVDPQTGEMNVVWDGKMEDSSEAEDGTYFYMIEVIHVGQKYNYKNFLELVRTDPAQ